MVRNSYPSYGPRPDAEPTSGLPTLVPGRDVLPTTCGHCGSGFLLSEPPLGPHARGMVWCELCSRSVAWLAGPLRSARREPPAAEERLDRAPVRMLEARRPIVAGRFETLASCAPACTSRYGHDALTHERAGRDALLQEQREAASGVVRTGPLVVDLGASTVFVDGDQVQLSGYVWELLAYVARRPGQVCRRYDIAAAVWDTPTAELWAGGTSLRRWRALRITMMRLRARLGPAASLIETVPGRGYRLAAVDPVSRLEDA